LPDYKSLVAGAIAGVNVIVLDPNRDGIAQITQVLARATQVSAIHIVSFGDEGVFTLGAAQVTSQSLDIYQNSIQRWSASFAPSADILLYGSNIGAGVGGAAFTQKLSDIAKAAVAASNDRTGKGGDWVLEVNTGAIATKIAFQAEVTSTYAAAFDLS
jgi:precorrin-3B methylase